MAKELPYFRFTAQEWQNGDISLESYEMQGLFISVCAYYWVQDCSVTKTTLQKKFKNDEKLIEKLILFDILSHEKKSDSVSIKFLNDQFDMLSNNRKARQVAGSKGGKQKSSNATSLLKQKSSYKDKDKDKDKDKEIEFDLFWNKYDKKIGREKTHKKFTALKDSEIKAILAVVDNYVKNTPDLQYRKNPVTWLNGKHWEDEVRVSQFPQIETLDVKRNENHLKAQNYLVLKKKEYLDNGVEWTNELGSQFYKEGLIL